jgi:hypothetical protein
VGPGGLGGVGAEALGEPVELGVVVSGLDPAEAAIGLRTSMTHQSARWGRARRARPAMVSSYSRDRPRMALASARNRWVSSTFLRSVMSRRTTVKRWPRGVSRTEMDASAGNSRPFLRSPAISRRSPMRRAFTSAVREALDVGPVVGAEPLREEQGQLAHDLARS